MRESNQQASLAILRSFGRRDPIFFHAARNWIARLPDTPLAPPSIRSTANMGPLPSDSIHRQQRRGQQHRRAACGIGRLLHTNDGCRQLLEQTHEGGDPSPLPSFALDAEIKTGAYVCRLHVACVRVAALRRLARPSPAVATACVVVWMTPDGRRRRRGQAIIPDTHTVHRPLTTPHPHQRQRDEPRGALRTERQPVPVVVLAPGAGALRGRLPRVPRGGSCLMSPGI